MAGVKTPHGSCGFVMVMVLFVGSPSDPCKPCLSPQPPCEAAVPISPASDHEEEQKEVRKENNCGSQIVPVQSN